MILYSMKKGSIKKIFTSETTHRVPKMATLALSTAVLVSMIAIDASASPNGIAGSIAGNTKNSAVFASESSLSQLLAVGRHHPVNPTSPVTTSKNPPSGGGGGGGAPAPTTTTTDPPPTTTTTDPPPTTDPTPTTAFPVGTVDSSAVSGYDPPAANALPGYSPSYSISFTGDALTGVWDAYQGQPGGDPGGMFATSHVIVSNGMLQINTFQDPAYGDSWVTGGLCLCGIPGQVYGAYFVRSRVTAPGATVVELLWPDGSTWPPEIDFNETNGSVTSTTATVHYSSANNEIHESLGNIDMTQWHTWGVIWGPTSVTFTVDGNVWATVTGAAGSVIPDLPMHISLQSETGCESGWACPTEPSSLDVAWVSEYNPS